VEFAPGSADPEFVLDDHVPRPGKLAIHVAVADEPNPSLPTTVPEWTMTGRRGRTSSRTVTFG